MAIFLMAEVQNTGQNSKNKLLSSQEKCHCSNKFIMRIFEANFIIFPEWNFGFCLFIYELDS